jgi:hypothetical protein
VSSTTKWSSPPPTQERRSNPRLKVSSLIYAQLGSDNGGIVLNLGMDGLACCAAHSLIADMNSVIHLRLRGSGLNADITGKLAWVAGTQKEVGISFKSLPDQVRQNIADWIARESQPVISDGAEQARQEKTNSAIAEIAVPEKRTALASLSAALALSRATSVDHAPPAPEALKQTDPLAESTAGTFPLAPTPGTIPATENSNPGRERITGQTEFQGRRIESNSPTVSESGIKNLMPINRSTTGVPQARDTEQVRVEVKKDIAAPQKPAKIAHAAPPQAPTEISAHVKIAKNKVAESLVNAPISAALRRLYSAILAQKSIPQSFLSAWKGLNVEQKKLLTHIGSGCVGLLIGLILILALNLSHGSSKRSSEGKFTPQSTIRSVSPDLNAGDLHDSQDQPVATKSTISSGNQPLASQPQPSVFSKVMNGIFGNGSDGTSKISDYQMGLEVWTSQSTGYYYCSDDPYAKQVQPGSPMLQGDALQAGYRPRLGQFCN